MEDFNTQDWLEQLTQEQAIAIHDSGMWKDWSDQEIVRVQLFQDRLCVPFKRFRAALECVMGRPVFTHELANTDRIIDEYLGIRDKPTMQEIIELIPEEKRIIFNAP